MDSFDLLIVNQGIAGLALACGLGDGFRIAIIEHTHFHTYEANLWDLETSLVNITSIKILQYLKIWHPKISDFSVALHKLEILKNHNISKIVFNSGYLGYLDLGYIIDKHLIYQALIDRAQQLKNITFISSYVPESINYHEDAAFITIANNYTFKAKLVIGADGINSWVRNAANLSIIFRDNKYYGLTTIIQTEKTHNSILRYIVHNDGLVMLLPLKNMHLSVVFWLLPPYAAKKYLYVSDADQSINEALIKICNILGLCIMCDNKKYNISLLRMQYTHKCTNHRLVLLGNAAHTMCPLFFQNINSELIDAAILLHYLKNLKESNKDIGYYSYLKYYEHNRKHRIIKDFMYMPHMYMFLHNKNNLVKYIQCFIYYLINTVPNLKMHILHRIMGLNNMPEWLLKDHYN
ncbi:FAD-dependent monooxygenase [Blochmannia endosymbiont of Camponotus sp. C-003]|uniref:FAD-dependent monooxygenase n=1 Tax=Blochmannia endosymbiont of Camponotus sp. C-003 TaxID=2945588 RepID=UPI00202419EC|nr:FAD-dependent monooxygenase [Blochmannia endosymbiont of Camponotus sp. C-003]URJ23548.1 FAD-dependent monooxygenase [Blochmannia endosymbiont of Camponotus sp. C-003]